MGVQQSLDLTSSPRSIKVQMACFRQYIKCTPSWLNIVMCVCATTGVRPFRGCRLYSTGGRILKMQSSYNSTVAAGILTETALMCSFQPVYWEHSLDGNSTHVFLPTRLLGTITRCVLRLYIQLEAILDSVPAVMA